MPRCGQHRPPAPARLEAGGGIAILSCLPHPLAASRHSLPNFFLHPQLALDRRFRVQEREVGFLGRADLQQYPNLWAAGTKGFLYQEWALSRELFLLATFSSLRAPLAVRSAKCGLIAGPGASVPTQLGALGAFGTP